MLTATLPTPPELQSMAARYPFLLLLLPVLYITAAIAVALGVFCCVGAAGYVAIAAASWAASWKALAE